MTLILLKSARPKMDHFHVDLHVTYARVIIVCFHDTLSQLKYFELEYTLQSNFACPTHNDPDSSNKVYDFV